MKDKILQVIFKALRMFWKALKWSIGEIKDRRVIYLTALYYVGVWNFLEPSSMFLGFTENTIEILKNIGMAASPVIILLIWFHGKPGQQKTSKIEVIAMATGFLISGYFYYNLAEKPTPEYSVVTHIPESRQAWFYNNILKEFEQKNDIKLNIVSYSEDYEDRLYEFLQSGNDSSNVLLVQAPLHYTGVLLNTDKELLYPFDKIAATESSISSEEYSQLLANLDTLAVKLGQRNNVDENQYYLPFEYRTMIMVYAATKVAEATKNWMSGKEIINSTFFKVTGQNLPQNYVLEADPCEWDYIDLFVAGCFWSKLNYDGLATARIAVPCTADFAMFSYSLNRSLSQDARLYEIFNWPGMKSITPPGSVEQFYRWERSFQKADLYYPGMWLGMGLTQHEIVEVFKAGKIFLAFITNDNLMDLIQHNSDIAVATLPTGLDYGTNKSVRRGFSDIEFWAVPKRSASYRLSYRLAEWLLNEKNQASDAEAFISIPTLTKLLQFNPADSSGMGKVWRQLKTQVQINKKDDREINPYKDFTKADYDILLRFYHQKWRTFVMK